MRKVIYVLLIVFVCGLTACGGGDTAPAEGPGDAAAGEVVYNNVAAPACGTCHSLEPGVDGVGPSLGGIAAGAGSRVPGVSAAEFLRRSVTEPNADVAEGFVANVMPATYGAQLSEEQLNDLVAYLLTLK
jgi:mono/diheme cytochrome c family protein